MSIETAQHLFLLIIAAMIGAYGLVFLLRGGISSGLQKFIGRFTMSSDDASAILGQTSKHQRYLERLEAEKREQQESERIDKLREETEKTFASGENLYPTHTTKRQWIEKEYRVGEEKESTYPQTGSQKKHKPITSNRF